MPVTGRNIVFFLVIFLASFLMVLFIAFDQGLLQQNKANPQKATAGVGSGGNRTRPSTEALAQPYRRPKSTGGHAPQSNMRGGEPTTAAAAISARENSQLLSAWQTRPPRNAAGSVGSGDGLPSVPPNFSPQQSPQNQVMQAVVSPTNPLVNQQATQAVMPLDGRGMPQANLPNYPYAFSNPTAYSNVMMAAAQETAAPTPAASPSTDEAPFNNPPPDETMPPPEPKPQEVSKSPETEKKKKEEKDSPSEKSGDNKTPEAIGVPPPRPQPEFLRDTSVLLDPGQYQFESGIAYTSNITDTVIGQLRDDQLIVANLRTTSRNLQVPMEFRVGLTDDMQGSISLPIGFANQAISVGNTKDAEDRWGIGDLSVGLTRVLREGKNGGPNILGNLAFSAPTADTSFPAAQQVPGANLGSGFWTVSTGITAVQNIDPIAVYYGLSYSNTFETTLPNSIELDPGNILSYRLGVGYAVNSRIALSAAFEGNYIGELKLNDTWISGSAREPFTIRLAATIQSNKSSNVPKLRRRKSTEPFIRFGLSEASPDVSFGLRWTY